MVHLNQLKNFSRLGIGTSIFQLSSAQNDDLGQSPNQWHIAANQGKVPPLINQSSVWQTMDDYIPILASMGIKHLRFSLEWSFIEPKQGYINPHAMQTYLRLIRHCLEYGIEPMLTLYHFTQPHWFSKAGGFLKSENIPYFLQYCHHVIQAFIPYVRFWCTINEPAVEAFSSYFLGIFPPKRVLNFSKGSMILKNLLMAHVEICQEMMTYEKNQDIKYGLVHNILEFESQSKWIEKYFTGPISRFTRDLVLDFLNYGRFHYRDLDYMDTRYKGNSTFVNIYGAVQVDYRGPTCAPHQTMGDMYIAIYPESYKRALDYVQEIKLPIYITETGIADANDGIRPQFIIDFLKIIFVELQKGVDIQGLFFWTFKDNYEWHQGYQKKFGLFDLENIPKNSAFLFTWICQQMQSSFAEKPSSPQAILEDWIEILNTAELKVKANDWDFFKTFAQESGILKHLKPTD